MTMIIILDQQHTIITAIKLCKACHNMCEQDIFTSIMCFHFFPDELSAFSNEILGSKV